MTVAADDRRREYPGNGVATDFNGPMAYSADVVFVYLVDDVTRAVTPVATSGFDLQRVGREGGTRVVMVVPPPIGQTLLLLRNVTYSQLTDITNQSAFNADVLERGLDLLAMQTQQLADGINRSLRVSDTVVGFSSELTDPVPLSPVVVNANGDGFESGSTTLTGDMLLRPNLALPSGSSLVGFLQSGTGAVPRTAEQKMLDTVNARDYGVVANGVTDDSAKLQAAMNYCASTEKELILPEGDILLNTGLTHSSGALYMRGSQAGTQGTRLLIKANAPAITITAQCTIENVGFIGEASGAKTLQAGVYINNTNNVNLREVVFDSCYDSIKLLDTCFYCDFDGVRMFNVVRAHFYGSGVTAPGYAIQISRLLMTPGAGQYGFDLSNVGSLVLTDCVMSPANLTERCMMWRSNASLSGDSRFSNVVFEGSVKESLRIEGTAPAPVKYVYFSNCYFNQSGAGLDAITLGYVQNIRFVNSYISGTGSAVTLYGDVKYVSFVNADMPGGGANPMIRALGGATVDSFDVDNPSYTGSNRFLDFSAITATNAKRVTIDGGRIGTHANPVLVTVADAAQYKVNSVGQTMTRNGGLASFNGGVSLFLIPHGLLGTPSKVSVIPQSTDAGTAEIREVTVTSTTIDVQCKAGAAGGANNVRWLWTAEL